MIEPVSTLAPIAASLVISNVARFSETFHLSPAPFETNQVTEIVAFKDNQSRVTLKNGYRFFLRSGLVWSVDSDSRPKYVPPQLKAEDVKAVTTFVRNGVLSLGHTLEQLYMDQEPEIEIGESYSKISWYKPHDPEGESVSVQTFGTNIVEIGIFNSWWSGRNMEKAQYPIIWKSGGDAPPKYLLDTIPIARRVGALLVVPALGQMTLETVKNWRSNSPLNPGEHFFFGLYDPHEWL